MENSTHNWWLMKPVQFHQKFQKSTDTFHVPENTLFVDEIHRCVQHDDICFKLGFGILIMISIWSMTFALPIRALNLSQDLERVSVLWYNLVLNIGCLCQLCPLNTGFGLAVFGHRNIWKGKQRLTDFDQLEVWSGSNKIVAILIHSFT